MIYKVFYSAFLICLIVNLSVGQTRPYDILDYEGYNQVSIPNSSLSRNKIQNPSFEQGTHLWTTIETGNSRVVDLSHDEGWFEIDSTVAYHGHKSARLSVWDNSEFNHLIKYDEWQRQLLTALQEKGEWPNYVHPFITSYYTQLQTGVPYAVTFYAKSEVEGLEITMHAASKYGDWSQGTKVALTTGWKRYEFQFIPKEHYVSIIFGQDWTAPRQKDLPSRAYYWMDAIQLEKGTSATSFTLKPLITSINRMKQMVDLNDSKRIEGQIHNFGSESRDVSSRLIVKDFFKGVVHQEELIQTKIPAGQHQSFSADITDYINYVGYYTLEFHLKSGDYVDREIFRYAVYDADAVTDLKHQAIFGYGGTLSANHKETIEKYKKLGLGLMVNNSHNNMDRNYVELWKDIGSPVLYPIVKRYDGYLDLRETPNMTGAELDSLIEDMRSYFQEYNYIKNWKVVNEPEYSWRKSFIYDPEQLVEYMKRLYPMIKEVIPDATIVSPDLASVSQGALDWVEEVFRLGGGKYFDVLSIHTYQKTPELPSLDNSLSKLEAMADKYDFKGEIWLTEGGHYVEQHFPPMNFDATIFEGHFDSKMPHFTEDLSGYPVGVALSARTALIVLKHGDRVRANTEWALSNLGFETLSMMPRSHAMMYHGLASMLGSSQFVKEYSLAKNIVCYLFEDEKGGGLAAIWDFDRDLALDKRDPLSLRIYDPRHNTKIKNIFGSTQDIEGSTQTDYMELSIGYMPQFVAMDDLEELKKTLEKSYILFDKKEALTMTLEMADPYTLELDLFNQYHENLSGKTVVSINGSQHQKKYNIASQDHMKLPVSLKDLVDFDQSSFVIDAQVKVYDEQGQLINTIEKKSDFILAHKLDQPMKIDGRIDDWQGIEPYVFTQDVLDFETDAFSGPKDLSAKYYSSWDEDNFYMAIVVNDDKHLQSYNNNEVYQNDGLQVFFDMYNNGTLQSPGLEDDYAWHFSLTESGPEAFKAYVPAWQTAFLKEGLTSEVNIQVRRDENSQTTTYEVSIPRSHLMPLNLKQGVIFGMAVMINDSDSGKRDTGLMNTGGKEPWKNPGVYPDMILMK